MVENCLNDPEGSGEFMEDGYKIGKFYKFYTNLEYLEEVCKTVREKIHSYFVRKNS